MKRFEQFNEMIFESYCKKSIDNAILKERQKKATRNQVEQSLSTLTDTLLLAFSTEDNGVNHIEEEYQIFHVRNMSFHVCNQKLAWALFHLMPRDREIVLLYFFGELKDEKVASLVHMSRPSVSRRRKAALAQLRKLLEDST